MSCDPAKWRSGRGHLLTLRRLLPGKKEKKKRLEVTLERSFTVLIRERQLHPSISLWVTLFITLLCFLSRFSPHLSSTRQLSGGAKGGVVWDYCRIALLPPSWAGRRGNVLLQLIKINGAAAIFKGQVFYYLHWSVLYNSSPHIRLVLNHLDAG